LIFIETGLVQMSITVGKSAPLCMLQKMKLNLLENAYIQCMGFKVIQP